MANFVSGWPIVHDSPQACAVVEHLGLRKALEALRTSGADAIKSLITTKTFDEKQMEKLKLQFENMAPSLAKIRGGALDVGLY